MSFLLTCPNCGEREVTDFSFGGEVVPRPEAEAERARAQRLQLLSPQRRRRAARVVVPPLRLPRVVPGRARHDHQRGQAGGPSRDVERLMSDRLPPSPRRAHQPRQDDRVQLRRQERRGVRGRHDRLRAARVGAEGAVAQLQVPPPARPALLRRPVPQLPGRGRRLARRPCLHRAGQARHAGEAHEREALAALRRDAGHRHLRHARHPAGLLLQDLHPAAAPVAAVREGPAERRRARQAAPTSRSTASGAPSTAAATRTCW